MSENQIIIKAEGRIVSSNLKEQADQLIKEFENINTELKTDDDFFKASKLVTKLKTFEDGLKNKKQEVLEQVQGLGETFALIDEVGETAKSKRLILNRQVTEKKNERREEIIDWGKDQFYIFIEQMNKKYSLKYDGGYPDFTGAIKGMAGISQMKNAIEVLLIKEKDFFEKRYPEVQELIVFMREGEGANLFPDAEKIAWKSTLRTARELKETRIAEAKARREAEAERVRIQEQERAEREQQEAERQRQVQEVEQPRVEEVPVQMWELRVVGTMDELSPHYTQMKLAGLDPKTNSIN